LNAKALFYALQAVTLKNGEAVLPHWWFLKRTSWHTVAL